MLTILLLDDEFGNSTMSPVLAAAGLAQEGAPGWVRVRHGSRNSYHLSQDIVQNPKPQTLSPKPKTLNPKPLNPRPKALNPKPIFRI